MLSNIFKERYGKLLIGFCFVLLLMYLGDGWQSQKAWHQQEHYLTSEEFIKPRFALIRQQSTAMRY